MFLGIFSVWGVSFCLSAYSSKCFTGMIMCFLSLGTLSHDFIKSVLCTLLSYPSSYSSPLTTSKFSCTPEIMHVLAVLSYFFLFCCLYVLFQLSFLQVMMLCLSLSWSNLCGKFYFFIIRISIWLFCISLYWIPHSFSVVFLISFRSLLLFPFDAFKSLCPLWFFFGHSLNHPF